MSPRSEEFMEHARDRVALARMALETGHLAGAVSAGYYAMLYAARAALSERDEYARTHKGTWQMFRERYVITDAFDQRLVASAQAAQRAREGSDYEAITPSRADAEAIVADAGAFIAAVERTLDA